MESTENDDRASETSDSGDENYCDDLYMVLNSISANLDQLSENCRLVYDKINILELDCIDLLQPMGDMISLERELNRITEIESNYFKKINDENIPNDEDNNELHNKNNEKSCDENYECSMLLNDEKISDEDNKELHNENTEKSWDENNENNECSALLN